MIKGATLSEDDWDSALGASHATDGDRIIALGARHATDGDWISALGANHASRYTFVSRSMCAARSWASAVVMARCAGFRGPDFLNNTFVFVVRLLCVCCAFVVSVWFYECMSVCLLCVCVNV